MTDNALAVELRAQVNKQTATELTLAYELRNTTDTRIFVFDHLLYFDAKGATRRADTGAYVFADRDGVVRVLRGFIAPPMFMSVARRPPIVASAVNPGWASAGVVKLPLPLIEMNAYFPAEACDPASARPVSRLRIQVGWVEEREGTKTGPFEIDHKSLVRLIGGWGSPLQRTAQTEIEVTGVRLCPYAGRFDRPQLQQ
ncbi:hypothetical protein G3480_19175 [Thiorhodococcus mannitoliphagus]|uniref:Uncharacterized protein n=1 Tax=Thiorhodococcus mannitoliphagus TaxID=329406 RepID=A0A6P1DZB4_9GAMM|nr:hypothetical protein [Thiorhodococcus mannitoliphagus]NEX22403.1 hypothetical protein [Thiorhodococcus mannitoliphagus]